MRAGEGSRSEVNNKGEEEEDPERRGGIRRQGRLKGWKVNQFDVITNKNVERTTRIVRGQR